MTPPRKVLVVDDDADSQFAVEEVLELGRYDVASVASGADALVRLRDPRRRPSIVVLDLHLRDISGFEVLAEIQREKALRQLGVVVVTGDRAAADELRRRGWPGVVDKPFSIGTLLAEVAKVARG